MADKQPDDLVLSYTVHHNGMSKEHDAIQEALSNGYRIVDVFSTQSTVGGAGNSVGFIAVTVLLTKDGKGSEYSHRVPKKKAGAGA